MKFGEAIEEYLTSDVVHGIRRSGWEENECLTLRKEDGRPDRLFFGGWNTRGVLRPWSDPGADVLASDWGCVYLTEKQP